VLHGAPPKLVMLQMGNCSTREVDGVLRRSLGEFTAFEQDTVASLIELPAPSPPHSAS